PPLSPYTTLFRSEPRRTGCGTRGRPVRRRPVARSFCVVPSHPSSITGCIPNPYQPCLQDPPTLTAVRVACPGRSDPEVIPPPGRRLTAVDVHSRPLGHGPDRPPGGGQPDVRGEGAGEGVILATGEGVAQPVRPEDLRDRHGRGVDLDPDPARGRDVPEVLHEAVAHVQQRGRPEGPRLLPRRVRGLRTAVGRDQLGRPVPSPGQ